MNHYYGEMERPVWSECPFRPGADWQSGIDSLEKDSILDADRAEAMGCVNLGPPYE